MTDPTLPGHEWLQSIPFYCLVTDQLYRKPMVARILESALTAVVSAVGGGFLAVSIATAQIQERMLQITVRMDAQELRQNEHVKYDAAALKEHEAKEDRERQQILTMLTSINRCLMERTCTK